jgi:hypothetical protein
VTRQPRPNEVEVIPVGQAVRLRGGCDGHVTAVTIRQGGYVTYEVRWWDLNNSFQAWFEAFELTADAGETTRIGFKV